MSRGGRGGRGRGGRGGRGPAADLMRDTLEDIGGSGMVEPAGRGPPILYPPIVLNQPAAISDHDFFLIQKLRETTHRLENSPYFISLKAEETDIERYSDKYRKKGKELGLMECINNGISDSTKYIPAELLNGSVAGGRSSLYTGDIDQMTKYHLKRKRDVDLQKLEQQETAGGDGSRKTPDGKKGDDSDIDGDDDMNDPDEFEMDDDYGVDHYASGDDGGYDSGGDGEAFF